MSATVTVQHVIAVDAQNYLESSARIRGVSQTQLLRRVVEYVLKDQLILSILDDDNRPSIKIMAKRNRHSIKRPVEPRTNPQRPNAGTISFKRSQPKTREELRRELAAACANTASLPIE